MPDDKTGHDREQLLEGILGLGRDSGRKSYFPQFQETIGALKEERRKFEAVFRRSVALLALLTPDGIIEDINETAMFSLSLEMKDLVGRPFLETPWWDHDDRLKDRVKKAIESAAEGETVRFMVKHFDGEENEFYAMFSVRPLYDDNGGLEHILAEGQIITEIVKAEKRVRELNEHLEEKIRQRTDELEELYDRLFRTERLTDLAENTARVAHEINTPIGIARTAFSRIEEIMLPSGLSDEAQTLVRMISRNLERAAVLIKSFKQLSADQADESRRRYNLKTILRETSVTMGSEIERARQKIAVNCPDDIMMDGYPGAITTIFTNLISNSREHGYPCGEKGLISINVSCDEDGVAVTYSDDGIGMDEVTVKKAFETFYTTRREDGNTGLGMSLVYNLVTRSLGGTIALASKEGEGITVTMRLPLTAPENA